MNTVLALLGACLAAFATSAAVGNKLDMVHVQVGWWGGNMTCNDMHACMHMMPQPTAEIEPEAAALSLSHPIPPTLSLQNATLAGGVAIGSAANLAMPPACALAGGWVVEREGAKAAGCGIVGWRASDGRRNASKYVPPAHLC